MYTKCIVHCIIRPIIFLLLIFNFSVIVGKECDNCPVIEGGVVLEHFLKRFPSWRPGYQETLSLLRGDRLERDFFICYLAVPRPTFVFYPEGSLTHLMLITLFDNFYREGLTEHVVRLGS